MYLSQDWKYVHGFAVGLIRGSIENDILTNLTYKLIEAGALFVSPFFNAIKNCSFF